jgi:LPXTG-motif cell wall-anchored protein
VPDVTRQPLRAVAVVAGALATVAVLTIALSTATAQVRSPGGVTIHDDPNCEGQGNAAKVTPPFSVAITGLAPNSTTSQVYVTDKDAHPEIIYGPFLIPNVDGQGTSCININDAPAGTWKVDVVEDGSGFTDSKVFSIEDDPTSAPTTTAAPTTTTTAPSATTTTPPPIAHPWSLLPWTIGPLTSVPTTTVPTSPTTASASTTTASAQVEAAIQTPSDPDALPRTGQSSAGAIVAVIVLSAGALLLIVVGKRSRSSRDHA